MFYTGVLELHTAIACMYHTVPQSSKRITPCDISPSDEVEGQQKMTFVGQPVWLDYCQLVEEVSELSCVAGELCISWLSHFLICFAAIVDYFPYVVFELHCIGGLRSQLSCLLHLFLSFILLHT